MYYDSFRGDRYGRNTVDFSKDISEILRKKIKTNEIN
jgi:hypothetical protein